MSNWTPESWSKEHQRRCEAENAPKPELRTAQDADNALLVRALVRLRDIAIAKSYRSDGVFDAMHAGGYSYDVRIENGHVVLSDQTRAALRCALGEEA